MQKADTELTSNSAGPNPKRVAAGRLNRAKRKGLTPEGRERLRQSALKHKPWRLSTAPRTPEGKAQVALNGKSRQLGLCSGREARADVAELRGLLPQLR